MPGKCLSAQTEGDKCCWRGHDKLATVNLRTRSPTGGLRVDTILCDCWVGLTALMRKLTRSGNSPFTHCTHTLTYIYCKLFNVALFLPDSQLWFWSRFLWHICYILLFYSFLKQHTASCKASVYLNFSCCRADERGNDKNISGFLSGSTKSKFMPKKFLQLKWMCKVSLRRCWFSFFD